MGGVYGQPLEGVGSRRWNVDLIEFFGLRRAVGSLLHYAQLFKSIFPEPLVVPSKRQSGLVVRFHPRPPAGTTWRASETRRGDAFAAGRLITSSTAIADSRFCVLLAEKIKRKLEIIRLGLRPRLVHGLKCQIFCAAEVTS
jgi:hypothetical protein